MFSNAANNSLPFSEADLRRALASAEGRQLLAMLRNSSGDALGLATQAVRRGDYASAQAILEPLLRDPRAKKLMEQLQSQK